MNAVPERDADSGGVPSRPFHWLRAHWFRLAIAAFTLATTLIEWAAIPPVYPLNFLFSGLSVIAIVLSPFLPRISGWFIIMTVVARLFVLDLSGPNPLWAAYLALAVIGYDSAIPVAVGALLTVIIAECVPVALNTFNALSATWIGMVNYIGMFTLAAMGGMSFRWRRQRDEMRERAVALERRQWELDTLQRNTRLASRIHDSASGGLSYIALTAQRELRRIGDDAAHAGEREDWRFVNEQALSVLDEIHHVIDLLERPLSSDGDGRQVPAAPDRHASPDVDLPPTPRTASHRREDVSTAARAAEARLARLGFHGRFDLHGETDDDCSAESLTAAANLIDEIAANITRHMSPDAGEYRCVITFGENAVEIMETNPIAPQNDAARNAGDGMPDAPRPHGSGLALHRRIIRGMGGELNTTAEDCDWILYARIPTRPGPARHRERAS
ncbi:YIP1 family protein [Bifidobacterium stellenboschense]|uniref:Signal transduction histidine kinase-like protein n=1 Tax=Bifidobacterium stellenboschense TaxID=762211 RepID=A0A087DGC7_9BIFI|nr:YIP1 family protein [Bifidobacterium stellenboschense]KFI94577.1 signal transduction histidine kinase-like protein [Bifidobacterium stellenboschense]